MCLELWRDDDAEGVTGVSSGDTGPWLYSSYVPPMTGPWMSLWSFRNCGKSSIGDGTLVVAVDGFIQLANDLFW